MSLGTVLDATPTEVTGATTTPDVELPSTHDVGDHILVALAIDAPAGDITLPTVGAGGWALRRTTTMLVLSTIVSGLEDWFGAGSPSIRLTLENAATVAGVAVTLRGISHVRLDNSETGTGTTVGCDVGDRGGTGYTGAEIRDDVTSLLVAVTTVATTVDTWPTGWDDTQAEAATGDVTVAVASQQIGTFPGAALSPAFEMTDSGDWEVASVLMFGVGGARFDDDVDVALEVNLYATPADDEPLSEGDDGGFWVDVTDRTRMFTTARGRQFELDRVEAGSMTATLNNHDGAVTPGNTMSLLAAAVRPRCPIRVLAVHDGRTWPIWTGFVEAWQPGWPATGKDAVVDVTAADALKLAVQASINKSYEDEVTQTAPIAWWRFDDLTGGGRVLDEVGDHHLLMHGSPTTGLVGPLGGGDEAFGFDGTDDYGNPDNASDFELAEQDRTLEAWVYIPGVPASSQVIFGTAWNQDGERPLHGIGVDDVGGELAIGVGSYAGYNYTVAGVVGAWNHIVASYEYLGFITRIRLYVNGDLVATQDVANVANGATDTAVARAPINTDSYFEGRVSEVAFYDQLIEQSVITRLVESFDAFPAQRTDRRVVTVLDEVAWPSHLLEIVDAGSVQMAKRVITDETSIKTLLDEAAVTERGDLYVGPAGRITFRSRQWRILHGVDPLAAFGDDPDNELPYTDLVLSFDDERIFNHVTVTTATETDIAKSGASIAAYGLRSIDVDTEAADKGEAASYAAFLLDQYAIPALRVETLAVAPQSKPVDLWPVILGRDFGQLVSVLRRLPGDDAFIECHIESVAHTVTMTGRLWATSWQLSPASGVAYWLLGVAGFSELDETTRVGF